MKLIRLIIVLLFSTVFVKAQTTIKFRKIIGNNGYDYGYSAMQTHDLGYIIGGATTSFGEGTTDMYAVKTDSMGVPKLHKTFGGINIDKGISIKQTNDKGYIFLGYTNSFGAGGYDIYLVKIDSLFNTEWEKTYGGTDWDFGNCVEQTNDGGFILCGSTYSYGNGDQDCYLIKTDSLGDTLWTKTYGGMNEDIARSVIQTSDSGYIFTGTTKSMGDINGDIYTIKTTATGDTLWTHTFGEALADHGNDVIINIDGDILIGGETILSTGLGGTDGILMKLSPAGAFINTVLIGGGSYDNINSIAEDTSGRIAMIGNTNGFGALNGDMYFMVLSRYWAFINSTTYGTIQNDFGYSIEATADKSWIICGHTNRYNNGLDDIYLIKTDTSGLSGFTGSESIAIVGVDEDTQASSNLFRIYPNPADNYIYIGLTDSNKNSEVIVTDIAGREISRIRPGTEKSITLNTTEFLSGIYLLTLRNENGTASVQKLVISH